MGTYRVDYLRATEEVLAGEEPWPDATMSEYVEACCREGAIKNFLSKYYDEFYDAMDEICAQYDCDPADVDIDVDDAEKAITVCVHGVPTEQYRVMKVTSND